MYLAPDSHGNPIDVMGEFDEDGVLWVVHAMALRRGYEPLYREVNGHP
jgi:hypothetical protein